MKHSDKVINQTHGENWTMYHGDCVPVTASLPDNSIHYTIHSPPFSQLYIYSDSQNDMGNSADHAEFFSHYAYLIRELERVTIPGRLCSVHCKDLPLYMNRDGAAGLYDFPGDVIKAFKENGWTFQSRVTIWKDPVIEMQRTKNHGLLYKNFQVRGEVCRQGMADYVLTFRKWGGVEGSMSDEPVIHDRSEFPLDTWQKWASPVWMDVDQTNVLNYTIARESEDEKHICPLQLDVIERCVALWSNPGDIVFSPFAGVGSEGYVSLSMPKPRKFIGVELKESYYNWACRYLKEAEQASRNVDMFASAGIDVRQGALIPFDVESEQE